MSAFKGYLLKAGNSESIFPHQHIDISSYKSTPNQREEIEAYRDDYTRDLTRVTADGMKTSIEFQTLDGISLEEKMEIQDFFKNCMINEKERKVHITYWDDENNLYETSYFYLPDTQYTIDEINEKDKTITYKSLTYKLVEY